MGILSEFINWLPGYFFPKICYGCERERAHVCDDCRKTVDRTLDRPVCTECGREAAFGATHPGCRRKYGLDGLISYYKYAGWAKEMVREAKFGKHHRWAGMKELASELASESRRHFFDTLGLGSSLTSSSPLSQLKSKVLFGSSSIVSKMPSSTQTSEDKWIIVPVPLHWWRELKRGFNQAELVAKELAEGWKIPMVKMLVRKVYTEPQTLTEKEIKLTKDQEKELDKKYKSSLQLGAAKKRLLNKLKAKRRKKNIEGAFKIHSEFSIPAYACHSPASRTIRSRLVGRSSAGRHHSELFNVILVDDVWTTGATMKECCRVLKLAGAKKVWGVTLLRA